MTRVKGLDALSVGRQLLSRYFCFPSEKGLTLKVNKFFPFRVNPFFFCQKRTAGVESKQVVMKVATLSEKGRKSTKYIQSPETC